MPTLHNTQKLTISYVCPECTQRVERKVPFITGDKGKINLASAGWCSHVYCEARHKLSYKVIDKNKHLPKITELIFVSNEIEYKKVVKILAVC